MSTPPKDIKVTPACMACLEGVCRSPKCRSLYEGQKQPERLGSVLRRMGYNAPYLPTKEPKP